MAPIPDKYRPTNPGGWLNNHASILSELKQRFAVYTSVGAPPTPASIAAILARAGVAASEYTADRLARIRDMAAGAQAADKFVVRAAEL